MKASQLLDALTPLNVDQIWCIVDNLLGSQILLKKMVAMGELEDPEPLKITEEVLDALSPNWREAESCKRVKLNPVITLTNISATSCVFSETCREEEDGRGYRADTADTCTICFIGGLIGISRDFVSDMTQDLNDLSYEDG